MRNSTPHLNDQGLSPRRQGTDHLSLPKSLTRSRTRWTVELAASSVISEGEESAETPQQKKKEKELKAEEDSDTPIFYIKGLKDGGGVGVWGDEDDGKSRPLEGGDAVSAAKAMKNAISRNTMGGAAEVEEGEEEKAADNNPVWERIQASLGLGTWSYVGLGVSLFLILLNNFLGLGWLARFLVPDFDPLVGEGQPSKSPSQNQEIETMPLGAPSNFLSL